MSLPKIVLPEFKTKLPSNDKAIKYTPMTIKDEKVLLIAKESGEADDIFAAIGNIVEKCVSDTAVKKLPMCDIEWLFLQIRKSSVSNIVNLSYTENASDDSEEKEIQHEFKVDLNKVGIQKNKKIKDIININSDVSLKLKWPAFDVYLSEEYKNAEESEQFNLIILSSIVKIINGEEMTDPRNEDQVKLKDWILSLPAKTYQDITEFFDNTPKLHYEVKYLDRKGKEQKIVLSTLNDFFTF